MRITTMGKRFAATTHSLALAWGGAVAGVAVAAMNAGQALAVAKGGGTCNVDLTNNPLSSGAQCAQAAGTSSNLFAQGGVFQTVADTLIFLVGAVAVIFLIIGGLRYVVSNGDSKAVEGAKNTILYAIIGIVVAVISFALVSFVITSLGNAK